MTTRLHPLADPIHRAPADTLAHLESRVGLRLASLLDEAASQPEHAVAERLRFAREQALARARARRAEVKPASAAAVVGSSSSGAGILAAPGHWLGRMAAWLPLLALVAGLVAIDELSTRAEIEAAAEVDTALLGDDLPPAAYTDPGFVEFLKSGRE